MGGGRESGYELGGLFAEYLPASVDTIMFIVCVFVNVYVNEATFMSIHFFLLCLSQ